MAFGLSPEDTRAITLALSKRFNSDGCKQWEKDAGEGLATSSSPPMSEPAVVTPSRNPYVEIPDSDTPMKVLMPYRKAQMVAEKKLELQLKQQKDKPPETQSDKTKPPPEESTKRPKTPKTAKTTKSTKTTKTTKSAKPAKPSTKKQRKASAGPMQVTMAAFLKAKKEKGFSHRDAVAAWMVSGERRKIVESLGASECKRRRFCFESDDP